MHGMHGDGGCRSDCKPARQWGVSGSLYAMRVVFALRRLLPTPTVGTGAT
jgi:hypothetical protein